MLTSTPLINRRLTRVINQSVTLQVEVDDELERSRLRRQSDIHRQISIVGSPKSPQLSTDKEIREHFEICLKLFVENKISRKNVWKLKMIDCMVQSQSLTRDSLHVASTSLDVSTKIYGIRVDSLHTEGLKLACNLARSNDQTETDTTVIESVGLNDADWNNEVSRRKNRHLKSVIAKNPESLLGDVPKLPSVFFQISTDPKASPIENLLSSKIPMNHGRYKYMLLSKEKAWPLYGKKDPNINFEKTYLFNISRVKNLQICAPFADFEIDEWNPEEEASLVESNNTPIEDEVVYNTEGIPIPVLDGSLHDWFENAADAGHQLGSSGGEEIHREAQGAVKRNNNAKAFNFRSDAHISANEYCYSYSANMKNKIITQVWAGPSHWMLKHVQHAMRVFSGQQEKQTVKGVKKTRAKPPLINFRLDIPGFDKAKIYKLKQCRIDISPTKCNLPLVTPIKSGIFWSLNLRPHVFINSQGKLHNENIEIQNPNGSSYCSRQEFDENNNGPAHGGEVNEEFYNEQSETLQHNVFDENVLQMSELVPKTCPPYGLRSRKIDMKKLKKTIWKSLVSKSPGEVIHDETMYERIVVKKNFSDVFKETQERVPHQMKTELSCPLAFVALLHVASKHNLQLTGPADLNDFTIEQTNDESFL